MISGKVALGGLTLEFGNAEKRFQEAQRTVEALTRAQTKLLEDEKGLIESLARSYLPELSPQAVSSGLVELREQMDAALREQASHRRELEARLAELPEEVGRRELLVAEAEKVEEDAARSLEEVRDAVERELGANASHSSNVAEHRAIMERRSILRSRRARLRTTAGAEHPRYEEDEAFAYLLRRGYGGPDYRAGFFGRRLDGWLARRIDFATLHRNYRILKSGPRTIQAEIKSLSDRAEALERDMDQLESEVAQRAGLHPALEAEAAAQRALLDARGALSVARATHDRLSAEIRAVDASRGRPYEDAVAMHGEFLQEQTIRDLFELARSTPDPQDDDLVEGIEKIRGRIDEIGSKLAASREELARHASRTTSLADVARGAVARFTSRRSGFPEELNLGKLVASLIDGGAGPAEALERMEAAHMRRPLLAPARRVGHADGLFAELSSRFDPELGAVSIESRDESEVQEVVVYDHHGRVLHRRVTRRKP